MTPLGQSPSIVPEIFWGEVAPCEHLVQFYDDDQPFLDSLEGFVHGGIRAGESVIVNGWPQSGRFEQTVTQLIARARQSGRRVRAFGEMVAILRGQGHNGATVRLEQLWHALCNGQDFPLFCAYPRSGFTQGSAASIQEICAAHSRVIAA